MSLTTDVISRNYQSTLQLVETLLRRDFRQRGYDSEISAELDDLCLSVIGHEPVVLLIQQVPFEPSVYQPLILSAIDEVKRLFFPDIRKKRFVSIDALNGDTEWLADEPEIAEESPQPELADALENLISRESCEYLQKIIAPVFPEWQHQLSYWWQSAQNRSFAEIAESIEQRLQLLKTHFPSGNFVNFAQIDSGQLLSDAEIRHIFLQFYLGMERSLPVAFLQTDGDNRAAMMVQTLFETLQLSPEHVLDQKDETFFIRHKLQSVYRYFNYSANRVLLNAFPAAIAPWQNSKIAPQFWDDPQNRVDAICWLVEKRLKLNPDALFRNSPGRDDFAANGLSYMFNTFYNSVSRALAEAYPEKQPWELGKVPFEFWNNDTAAAVIRWMIDQKNWHPDELPEKVRTRELTRKTFSEFGLATVFEKRFAKNIFRAISAAFPGRYYPWELGKVPGSYWEAPENVFSASRWVAEKAGIPETEIVPAVRQSRLTWQEFSQHSIGAVLKKHAKGDLVRMFAPQFWRSRREQLKEHKLLKKINHLKQAEHKTNLFHLLLYGLFYSQIQQSAHQNIQRYQRLERRIQLRSSQFSDR